MCVCLYLFSQQEDDHCFIIQDIEDQCREGLIMQNYDHLFLQSRYLFSARRSKKRLKLDCQFENKYINTTCFVREVTLLRICRSFCPEIFKTAKFFGDGSTPRKKDSVSELTENNALWWLIYTWEFQKGPDKLFIFNISGEQFFLVYFVVVILLDVTLEKAETWKPGTAHSTRIKYWQVFFQTFRKW